MTYSTLGSPFTILLYCPDCGAMITNDCDPRKDDVGTKFYKCAKCGKETSNPKRNTIRVDFDQKPEKEEKEKEEAKPQAERALELILEQDIMLFHDQHKAPYVQISIQDTDAIDAIDTTFETFRRDYPEVNTHKEIIKLKSQLFKTYISNLVYKTDKKVIGSEAVSNALNILHFKALVGSPYTLYNRVAPDPSGDGSIWYDMADSLNRAYHITKDGWTLENDVPILFRRYEHQQPLVEAVQGGDPKLILDYVNLGSTGKVLKVPSNASIASNTEKLYEQKKLLFMVQCASYLIPDIPHPILALFGCKGTWKSSSQTYVRQVFDPSSVPTLSMPRDESSLMQQLEHHWIPIYDNISSLPTWFSDALCRAVTGAGQETRELYTDDGCIIRQYKRCIMLNAINLPAQKGDLLDRTTLLETVPDPQARKTEEELNTAYQQERPAILGGFLDLMVKTLQVKDNIEPSKLFRLADFTRWGCAITEALGYTQQDFIDACEANLQTQNDATVDASPTSKAFIEYCNNRLNTHSVKDPFVGTPEYVFRMVTQYAEDNMSISTRQKGWAKSAQAFTRKLNESRDALAAQGWLYEVIPNGAKRDMQIWTTTATMQKHPQYVEPIVGVSVGNCPDCKQVASLEKQVTYSDQSKIPVCYACGEQVAQQISKGAEQ